MKKIAKAFSFIFFILGVPFMLIGAAFLFLFESLYFD